MLALLSVQASAYSLHPVGRHPPSSVAAASVNLRLVGGAHDPDSGEVELLWRERDGQIERVLLVAARAGGVGHGALGRLLAQHVV